MVIFCQHKKIKYWRKAESKYICDDAHIIFLYQQWLLAASHLTSNNMIIVPRPDSDHISISISSHQNPFPPFSWICTELCVSREEDNTLGANIDIILLCQTSLSAITIFGQPEVSFCSPFIERAINSRNTFFPLTPMQAEVFMT